MVNLKKLLLLIFPCFLGAITVLAQGTDCPTIVQLALQKADQLCQNTGRNQACYGHFAMTAEAQADAADFTFNREGDLVDLFKLQSLQLSPMIEATGQWGVAVMRVQANLPDTLPGQNVTFLLFGDTEITVADPSASATAPMQAFYLRTGIGLPSCEEAPRDGLLVQTPENSGAINLVINEVQVELGSTVFFDARAGGEMNVRTVEGAVRIENEFGSKTMVAGTQSSISLAEDLTPLAMPEAVEAYLEDELESLPIEYLEREIEIAEPLIDQSIELLNQYDQVFDTVSVEDAGNLLIYFEENAACSEDGACTIDANALVDYLTGDLGYEIEDLNDEDFAEFLYEETGVDYFDTFSDEDFADEEFLIDEGNIDDKQFTEDDFADEEFLDDESSTDEQFTEDNSSDNGGSEDSGDDDDGGGDDGGNDDGGGED